MLSPEVLSSFMTRDLLLRPARKVSSLPGSVERKDAASMAGSTAGFQDEQRLQVPVVGRSALHQSMLIQASGVTIGCCPSTLPALSVCLIDCRGVFTFTRNNCQITPSTSAEGRVSSPGCSCKVDGIRNDTLVDSAPETKTTHADRCCGYTIFLTTGQQKSSHTSDKGA